MHRPNATLWALPVQPSDDGLAYHEPFYPLRAWPDRWPPRERRLRVAQRLPRLRLRGRRRLQTFGLRPRIRSTAEAAGPGHAQARSSHEDRRRGSTLRHVVEQAAARCSRRIDRSSPAACPSTSCRRSRRHLAPARLRASRPARIAVQRLRSSFVPWVCAVAGRPPSSRRRRRAAGSQHRSHGRHAQARRSCFSVAVRAGTGMGERGIVAFWSGGANYRGQQGGGSPAETESRRTGGGRTTWRHPHTRLRPSTGT